MSLFQASIITPKGKIFDDQVDFIKAPGVEGEFGILGGHTPCISLLRKGIVKINKESNEIFFAISKGILEVDGLHKVLLLIDEGVTATNLQDAHSKLDNIN